MIGVVLLLALGRNALALDSLVTNGGYVRKSFTVEDGLSSNNVNAIAQTEDGFFWVGTKEGLLRFDGRHFTPISLLPQPSPLLRVPWPSPDGAASSFVGTMTGFYRFERGTFLAVVPDLWTSRIEEATNGNLRLGRDLKWDPDKEQIVGDEEAKPHAGAPHAVSVEDRLAFRAAPHSVAPEPGFRGIGEGRSLAPA